MTAKSRSRSSPALSASSSASIATARFVAMRKLLTTLVAAPEPDAPISSTVRPIASIAGRAAANASSSPPHMMVISPRSATGPEPETGASMNDAPRSRADGGEVARSIRVDGAVVDDDQPLLRSFEHAAVAGEHLLHDSGLRQAGVHLVQLRAHRGERLADGRAHRGELVHLALAAVLHRHVEPLADEVLHHGASHPAYADPSDTHHASSVSLLLFPSPANPHPARAIARAPSSQRERGTVIRSPHRSTLTLRPAGAAPSSPCRDPCITPSHTSDPADSPPS